MIRSLLFASLATFMLTFPSVAVSQDTATPLSSVDMQSFRVQPLTLADGKVGQLVTFDSRSPVDFAPMLRGEYGPVVTLNAQLFRPLVRAKKVPTVILVPGSANIGPHHLLQAEALVKSGIAVLIIDPFSGRGLTNSVSDQYQFSWAASVYDVGAAAKYLRSREDIDGTRLGALGGSRGGTAVMMAAYQPISKKLFGKTKGLKFVVAGYPWCGTQFRSSRLAPETNLLVMSGDKDDWVSVQQCQAATNALIATRGKAEMFLVKDGLHAFDRGDVAPRRIDQAVTSTTFPIVYMDDAGQYFDFYTNTVDPSLVGADLVRRSVDGGFTHSGVTIGSTGDQARHYVEKLARFLSNL